MHILLASPFECYQLPRLPRALELPSVMRQDPTRHASRDCSKRAACSIPLRHCRTDSCYLQTGLGAKSGSATCRLRNGLAA